MKNFPSFVEVRVQPFMLNGSKGTYSVIMELKTSIDGVEVSSRKIVEEDFLESNFDLIFRNISLELKRVLLEE